MILVTGTAALFIYCCVRSLDVCVYSLRHTFLTRLGACPKCGFTITPDLVKRVDFDWMECPKCGERFQPKVALQKLT